MEALDCSIAAAVSSAVAASVAALITFLGYVHLLFVSQFVEGAAFGALLVRATAQIVKVKS